MPYAITNRCIQCDNCLPLCPTGAITLVDGKDFWIDPALCNNCEGYYAEPQCVLTCPVDSPVPFQAKKGRCKASERAITSPDLFPNGKTNSFASAIVVWELCNILAQRRSLPWQVDPIGQLYYQRQVNQGQSLMTFHVIDTLDSQPAPLQAVNALATLDTFDIRAACLHLIYAAHAAALDQPWQEAFVMSDRQIESYLGLDKRKDLSKPAKLALIKELVQQPCKIAVSLDWSQPGKIKDFSLQPAPLWHLQEIQHHFQEDEQGCKHLTGLTFRIQAGTWTNHFLNRSGYKNRAAFYQYGTLPQSLLTTVMSIWQQHEGAARIMLWLLFKSKMGQEQRITILTLMRIAYGETKLSRVAAHSDERKRLLRTFESDLEVLNHYGMKPVFDPVTYPTEIQPLWAKLADLPDDAEAALEFWINDGTQNSRLTDAAPRGKWNRLMNARLLYFELPDDWQKPPAKKTKQKRYPKKHRQASFQIQPALSSQQIIEARRKLQLSQRTLAQQIGKSQSWVRDVERGRFQPTLKDQVRLCQILRISEVS
ncbi:helix-turn-helix domain-containing protein [Egbenema bharatensis]|uniref:helix-turn-helix domain-containing protein n=1 Tax=Egbenema bharatensis TaxID=3463334 RepID=UPI003A8B9992